MFGSDKRRWGAGILAAALLATAGCSLPYLAHVSFGQARILVGRTSIEDRLESDEVSEAEKTKLRLVLDVKAYAHDVIGLARSDSYTQVFDTEGQPAAWNLSACADDAFAPFMWSFPIVGDVPYKGYFDVRPATEEAKKLRAGNRDVVLRGVAAYSTLGWFADPIFTPMLDDEDDDLANTILHELAHATVFVKSDIEFNETLATFVGNQGTVDYFRARFGERDARLRRAIDVADDDVVFAREIALVRARLEEVYASQLPRHEKLRRKRETLLFFRDHFRLIVRPRMKTNRYAGVGDRVLDNAWILGIQRYQGDLELFHALHAKLGHDLRATVLRLKALADSDDPRAALKDAARS